MSKEIKQIRKAITERKKVRGLNSNDTHAKQIMPILPGDEEKHGFHPAFSGQPLPTKHKGKVVSGYVLKGILSIILFFGTALILQTDAKMFTSSKSWTRDALTDEFPFARVNQWYQETFGSPLAFAPEKSKIGDTQQQLALPVNGEIQETFQSNGSGIMIAPTGTSDVSVLQEGVIIFAGNDKATNKTVVVQHADGSKSTYGYLSSIDVHLYQFVASNQIIGKFIPNEDSKSVFFSIEKDDKYINPVQVIKVDDNS